MEDTYAQHMEIKTEDMDWMLRGLMNAGYECRVCQDGESMDVVMTDYINPMFSGHCFAEGD